ncbi:UNVERIFIED_ORG: hypothetical protein B2H93_13950 [Clostridium botulinum]
MDYMGWILSIYDECERRYNKKYIKKLDIHRPKEYISLFLKKENRYMTLLLGGLLLGVLFIIVLYFLGLVSNIEYYVIIPIMIFLLGLIPILYKYELELEDYEKKLVLLAEILEEHNLNKKEIKKLLLKQTKGILYRMLNILIGLIGILAPSGIFKYVADQMKGKIETVIPLILAILMISIPMFYIFYQIATIIPNNRILRRQKFHQLLKILCVYDIQESSLTNNEKSLNGIDKLTIKLKEHL